MMRSAFWRTLLCGVVLALSTSGCLYMNVRVPLDENFDKTDLGTKEGHASSTSILWLFAWGDAGTKAAATNGGISVIKHADRQVFVLGFGLYTRLTTVLYGD